MQEGERGFASRAWVSSHTEDGNSRICSESVFSWSKRNHYPKKTITWIQGNFPRSWSKGDVPFRHCQKICRHVNAGTQPHCEHTPWMSVFCEVGGWISEGIRQTTWLENGKIFRWKIFTSFPAAERNTQTIFRWKMEAIFRWKVKIFRTPPWRLS